MIKNKHNNNPLDAFTHKWIKQTGLEAPSSDLNLQIMQEIKNKTQPIYYAPLLSKKILVSIFIFFLCMPALLYFLMIGTSIKYTEWNIFSQLSLSNISLQISLSKITFYGLCFLALFYIQIPFLKLFIERRLQV